MNFNYWQECVSQSLDEHGVTATTEQVVEIAKDIEGAHECHGMAHYVPENPLMREVEELTRKLKRERDKTVCEKCWGKGRLIEGFGPGGRTSNSQCWKCSGEGYIYPKY